MRKKISLFSESMLIGSVLLVAFIPNTFTTFLLFISALFSLFVVYDMYQTKHSLIRNFPVVARIRWLFEAQRDKIRQYFNESDLDGVPFNREQRSIVYQRSKNEIETIPFGTKHDVYKNGYEFIPHSLFPKDNVTGQTIKVGSKHCTKPYDSSILNISAMSYGSLSGAAIRALNVGAKEGGFAHNTGEGGISPHHLQGGDLIFQIGTGYFGAGDTDVDGRRIFNPSMFKVNANLSQVKMVEIKLSQGAKPAHGGILPAKKNTEEIAKIRGIEPGKVVDSPPFHSAFSNFDEMVDFIDQLRQLSGGKPVGIKMCVGRKDEVIEMIDTFRFRGIYPDFITVDGSEGGTGSAPPEHTNSVGYPLADGLDIIVKQLKLGGLKDDIKVFGSGKVIDSYDIFRVLALGADGVNMARGFMFSLGCIQALECNLDTCPVGVATQDKSFEKGLVVAEKYLRVRNFHKNTIKKFSEFVGSFGLTDIGDINSLMINRRHNGKVVTLHEYMEVTF